MLFWYRRRQFGLEDLSEGKRDDKEPDVITEIVKIESDKRSWPDRTMGGYSKAGWRINRKLKPSKVALHPLGSFKENSLYTLPHSVRVDEEFRSAKVLTSPTPSSLSSHEPHEPLNECRLSKLVDVTDNEKSGNCLGTSPPSVTPPTRMAGPNKSQQGNPPSIKTIRESSTDWDHSTVERDTQPYEELTIMKIEPFDPVWNTVMENYDFTRDPSEIDVWSSNLPFYSGDPVDGVIRPHDSF
jgi:hypothetical protein